MRTSSLTGFPNTFAFIDFNDNFVHDLRLEITTRKVNDVDYLVFVKQLKAPQSQRSLRENFMLEKF